MPGQSADSSFPVELRAEESERVRSAWAFYGGALPNGRAIRCQLHYANH